MRRKQVQNRSQNAGVSRKAKALVRLLLDWFACNARNLPWRRTRDPYAIWVSEIMLQQTQVKTVVPYWEHWMRELLTLEALARARPAKIHKLWEGLGYYTRVRNLQKAARLITSRHGGEFPRTFDEILALPGIGRYTAGAICSIAFNQPKPVLDGNVIRVLTRLFGIEGDPREANTNASLWRLAEQLVVKAAALESRITHRAPRGRACSHLNQSLMELGAVLCVPRKPKCHSCPVARQCVALRLDRAEDFPRRKTSTPVTARRHVAFVVERAGRFLVHRRPVGGVNAQLWEFPNLELAPHDGNVGHAARRVFGQTPTNLERLCVIRHTITTTRITLEAHRLKFRGSFTCSGKGFRWASLRQMEALAFTSAHRRILGALKSSAAKPKKP